MPTPNTLSEEALETARRWFVFDGLGITEIARQLGCDHSTVKHHRDARGWQQQRDIAKQAADGRVLAEAAFSGSAEQIRDAVDLGEDIRAHRRCLSQALLGRYTDGTIKATDIKALAELARVEAAIFAQRGEAFSTLIGQLRGALEEAGADPALLGRALALLAAPGSIPGDPKN